MVYLWGRQWSRGELQARVGRLEQLAGVQLVEAADGAERGVRLLRFATGAGFDFDVLVDRGFDVGRARLGGRPLSWWSPVGLTGPWYYEPAGIGWFRGFPGGLVSTCGLDSVQLGGTDDATVFNYPHRRTETYGLHGRYPGLPARLAGYGAAWAGDECVLWAQGEVLQAAVFGEQLQLSRRIEADLGGTSVRITDTVTNVGATACPHMLRYRKDQLPHHVTWRQLGSGTYVVAMEPGTNRDAGRFDARERGELIHLAPGEQRHYELELGALTSVAQVEAFRGRNEELAAGAVT